MTKTEARNLLKGDYIPNGKRVDSEVMRTLQFRRTFEHEVYRCGRSTDYDPQSGPIYCGGLAEFIAVTDNGVVALCQRHAPPETNRVPT